MFVSTYKCHLKRLNLLSLHILLPQYSKNITPTPTKITQNLQKIYLFSLWHGPIQLTLHLFYSFYQFVPETLHANVILKDLDSFIVKMRKMGNFSFSDYP